MTIPDQDDSPAPRSASVTRVLRMRQGGAMNLPARPRPASETRSWLRRRTTVLLVLLPILGGLAGLLLATVTPPRYTAHSYVLLSDTTRGADVSAVNVAQATARIATKPSVLEAGGRDEQLDLAAQNGDLLATASPDMPLVDLSATADSGLAAALLANQLADRVQRHLAGFTTSTGIRADLFASATEPKRPMSPNTLVDVAGGAAIGALAAAIVFVLRRR